MTNLQRLDLEIQGTNFAAEEKEIFLEENGLDAEEQYNPASNTNKRNLYKTALAMLEALANNPMLMRSIKTDDMTITDFAEALNNRIQLLDRKIRLLPTDEQTYEDGASFVYMFRE